MKARVVYERNDAFDMQSGPYGYERVGFAIGDRVFWVGCVGSGMPGGTYEADKTLAELIANRFNAGIKDACYVCKQPILEAEAASMAHDNCAKPDDLKARTARAAVVAKLADAGRAVCEASGGPENFSPEDHRVVDAINKATDFLEGRFSWV